MVLLQKFKYKKMKKILLILVVLMCSITIKLSAQEMIKGTNFFNIGVGPSVNFYSFSSAGTPALKFSFDHGFKKIGPGTLTLGGMLGTFAKSNKGVTYLNLQNQNYSQHWIYLAAQFRVAYYYNFGDLIKTPELNAYAGFGSGIRQRFYSYSGPAGYNPAYEGGIDFQMSAFAGANYFVTKKIAFFTEFGYDISYFTAGVTFNL